MQYRNPFKGYTPRTICRPSLKAKARIALEAEAEAIAEAMAKAIEDARRSALARWDAMRNKGRTITPDRPRPAGTIAALIHGAEKWEGR